MDKLPVVGIVIPCHNHEKLVVRAINSVVSQDYPSKIVSIIDDGSSDDSYNTILCELDTIIEKPKDLLDSANSPVDMSNITVGLINKTPIFVLKNDKPTGPSAARNKAINAIWNKIHFFNPLDADDYHLPGKISKTVLTMIPDVQTIGLVYNDVIINNMTENTNLHEFRHSYNRQLLENENIISNSPLINKLALAKVGLYDENLRTCEDWDLWLRITEFFVAIHIPEPLQVYTVTGNNATFSVNKDRWQKDWQTVRQKMLQRRNDK